MHSGIQFPWNWMLMRKVGCEFLGTFYKDNVILYEDISYQYNYFWKKKEWVNVSVFFESGKYNSSNMYSVKCIFLIPSWLVNLNF